MILFGYFFILLICFYLLARVCDKYFIESLDKIAKKLRLNPTELMCQVMTWREEKWDNDPVAYVRKHIKEMD